MRLVTGSLILFAPTFGAADTAIISLETIIASQPEESYQYVRCAAFYLANVEWAGQAIDEETFENSKQSMTELLLIATLVRASGVTGELEHIANNVNLDARQIADLYAANFRQSYALRGTAWEANPVWESDAVTCRPIAEVASQVAAELGD